MLNVFAPQLLRNVLLMMRSRVDGKPVIYIEKLYVETIYIENLCVETVRIEVIFVEMVHVKAIKDWRTKRRYYWFYHRA